MALSIGRASLSVTRKPTLCSFIEGSHKKRFVLAWNAFACVPTFQKRAD